MWKTQEDSSLRWIFRGHSAGVTSAGLRSSSVLNIGPFLSKHHPQMGWLHQEAGDGDLPLVNF